jgi:hypothetical protein
VRKTRQIIPPKIVASEVFKLMNEFNRTSDTETSQWCPQVERFPSLGCPGGEIVTRDARVWRERLSSALLCLWNNQTAVKMSFIVIHLFTSPFSRASNISSLHYLAISTLENLALGHFYQRAAHSNAFFKTSRSSARWLLLK